MGPGCAFGTKAGTADTVFDLVKSNINKSVLISSFSVGPTLSPSSLSSSENRSKTSATSTLQTSRTLRR